VDIPWRRGVRMLADRPVTFRGVPEITDADMGVQEEEISELTAADPGLFRKQYTLFSATFSQFCYVGAQVAVAGYFINFAKKARRTASQASDLLAVAQRVYAFNRFLAGILMMVPAVKPRYMLATYLGMCFVFSVAASTTTGTTSLGLLIMVFVFESCCFATIFTLGLRGLGRHTKRGRSFLVAAVSGWMVFPPMMGAVVTARNAHVAMAIPTMGYVLVSGSFSLLLLDCN
jgi:FHS family L-fucose permease-like MFS transporter